MVKTLTSEAMPGALSSWRTSSAINAMLAAGARTTTAFELVSAVTTAPAKMPESMTSFLSASMATIDNAVEGGVMLSFPPSPSPLMAS